MSAARARNAERSLSLPSPPLPIHSNIASRARSPVLPPESGTSYTDPVTGDEYELNEKFFLKSESDGIVVHTVRDSSDPKEGLDRVVVMGPKWCAACRSLPVSLAR